ncbi:MAG: GGDEF domain-containing protein [Deltaproteobacteria bacterium]|nr:GGDEF domain-containing protein [Deltaproteobacteria bacterium]
MSKSETRITKISTSPKVKGFTESCLVQIAGPNPGKRFVLSQREYTVGRDPECDIVVDLDNVSRRHARFTLRNNRVYVEDLGSTNGTFVEPKPGEIKEETELRPGDFVKVGGGLFKFLSGNDLESLYFEEIYRLTILDGLTQVSNKRYLMEFLEREMGRCHRYGRALSLLMFDIDHFKQINDTQGHLAGDQVLRDLAQTVRARIRKEECFARYGGEEFCVVLPESGPDKARTFAEKIRKMVEDHPFAFEGKPIPVTVSMGVADLTSDMTEPLQFVKVADANLYKAKKGGRNRVVG